MKHSVGYFKYLLLSVTAVVSFCISPANAADPNAILNKWNAIVAKDFLNVSEIEGRVFIGGNYSVSNSHQFGFKLTKNVTSDVVFASAGKVTTNGQANIKVFYGSAAVANSVQNTAWFQFMQSGGTLSAPSSWAADNSPVADMVAASAYWRTLPSNSSATIPSGQPAPLKLICSENDAVAVFNLTDAQILDNQYAQQIELNVSKATTTVIINVNSLDGSINWNSGNMVSLFNNEKWQSRVLWNIYTDANGGHMGTINMNGNFKGALVSPTATIVTNSNIDGSVVCENLNIQSEIHNPDGGWNGQAPAQAPVTKLTDWTGTIDASESVCQEDAKYITTNGSVTLTPSETNAILVTSWQVVAPNDGSVDNSVHTSSARITKGTTFAISGYWPGVRPDDKLVKLHYTANVFDADSNKIKDALTRDISWDPTVCAAPLPKEADVKIEKTVSNNAPSDNENVTYTISATNNGPGEAKSLLVSDVLPAGLTYSSHTISQGTYEFTTGLWTVGNLANGSSSALSILVKVNFEKIYSSAFNLGVAKDYNLFVLQDLTQPSSDTEGRVAVGRDATLGNYSVGDKLPVSSGDVLVVGRKLTYSSGRVFNGNAVYGDETNITPSSNNPSIDGSLRKDNPVNFSAAKSYLESLSASLAAYTATGTTKLEWGQISLTGTDPYLNVFTVSGADLSASNDFQVKVPKGSVALVNISGTDTISWTGGQGVKGTAINNVVYNFYEAAKLKISGIAVCGSVLAPKSDVAFASGVLYGQMICKSMTGSGQFNLAPFNGNIPVEKSIINTAAITSATSADNNSANNTASVEITPKAPASSVVPAGGTSSGAEWKEMGSFTQGEMIYTIVRNDNSIYAGTVGGKIYKSVDAGASWKRINNDMNAGWIWSLCFNNGVLYASTERGVFKLTDGSWLSAGLKDTVDVRALASYNGQLFAGSWGRGVFVSANGGSSWTAINDGFNGSSAVQTLVFNGQGDLFAGTFDGGFYARKNGESKWTNCPVGNNIVWALGYSSGTIYAALYGDGLYSSTDNGATWTAFGDLDMPYVYSIIADDNGVVYASSWTSGVYCSVNSGASWSSLGMGGNGVTSLLVNGTSSEVKGLLKKNSSKKTAIAGTKEGKLYALDLSETTAVDESKNTIPTAFSLGQNYPNPFNPSSTIEVSIPKEGKYSLKIFNILGQEVASLLNGNMKAGAYAMQFNASRLASGVYIYRFNGTGVNLTKKMMILK